MWNGLPVIRKEIAERLITNFGLNQKEAAEKLGITPAAVCQYLSHKRGNVTINDQDLIKEMKALEQRIKPDEVVMVIDGTIGQQALLQAQAFHEATPIGAILVTKLDGTARGGGALSAVAATGAPIKFIGTGEKVEDIESFVPSRFVGRLLGMGDLETLLEKVKEAFKGKFLIGTALDVRQRQAPSDTSIVTTHFNAITPENSMKPMGLQPTEGRFRETTRVDSLAWSRLRSCTTATAASASGSFCCARLQSNDSMGSRTAGRFFPSIHATNS
jgi:predicted XRE-type DNA-binding protein